MSFLTNGQVTYHLGGQCSQLVVTVGGDDSNCGDISFSIVSDKAALAGGDLQCGAAGQPIQVNLNGVNDLTLSAGAEPQNMGRAIDFADAYLLCGPASGGGSGSHFDGQTWTTLPPFPVSGQLSYPHLSASGPSDAWVAGNRSDSSGVVMHWDGTAWGEFDVPGVAALWGSGQGDVWLSTWNGAAGALSPDSGPRRPGRRHVVEDPLAIRSRRSDRVASDTLISGIVRRTERVV